MGLISWQSGSYSREWISLGIERYAHSAVFTPVVQHYRFYYDGSESGSTPIANEDTSVTLNANGNYRFGLRYMVQETGATSGATTDDYTLQVSKNAGAYASISGSSSNVKSVSSNEVTDGAATTNRGTNGLTDGTGSFVAGEVEESNGVIEDRQLTASNYTEHLWVCEVVGADVANGDTLDFRISLNGGTPGMTNSVTPRITVSKPSTADYTVLTTGNETSADASIDTASISPSSNKLILLVVANRRNPDADVLSTVTGNGLTWSSVASQVMAGESGDHRISVWKANGSASSGVLTFTFANTQERVAWAVIEFAHYDGSVTQSVTNDQTSVTQGSVTLSAFSDPGNDTFVAWHSTGTTYLTRESTHDLVATATETNVVLLTCAYIIGSDTGPTSELSTSHNVAGIALEIHAEVPPMLHGRPYGVTGDRQMRQLLAT